MAEIQAIRYSPFAPTQFVREAVAAVLPLMDGDNLHADKSRVDVFEAVRPLFGHYTVSDGFLVWCALGGALEAELSEAAVEIGALREIKAVLESFVARASPSGAACVAARAQALQIDKDGEPSMVDANDEAAREKLPFDVWCLRTGRYGGEKFGDPGMVPSQLPVWLDRTIGNGGDQ